MWQNKKYIEQANKIGSKVINKQQQETSIFRLQELLQAQQTVTGTHPTCTNRERYIHKHMCIVHGYVIPFTPHQSKEYAVYIIQDKNKK